MFSATEITDFLACRHLTTLERARIEEGLERPFYPKDEIELLRALGIEHERAYLRHLNEELKRRVVEMPTNPWADAVEATLGAMRIGAEVIYQASFEGHAGYGRADFLVRVGRSSDLGSWSYEAVETKLARSTKANAIIQLCFYSELLGSIQGTPPERMHVVLGGGKGQESFRVDRYSAYFRKVRREYEDACRVKALTYPDPVEHCEICWWQRYCYAQWRRDDYVCLTAGITRNQRKRLANHGVSTVAGLAGLEVPCPEIDGIGEKALLRIRDQAWLQVRGRELQQDVYEFLKPIEPERGLAALPVPSAGDIFLDFESARLAFEDGLEYLTGFVTTPESAGGAATYECLWALDPATEKMRFEELIALLMHLRERYPNMHIYHYASYEQTAIKRLAGRHDVCSDEVDMFLRAGAFVDLYRIVQQGLQASVESYSIKKLEPLYGYVRSVPMEEANEALGIFEVGLTLGDPSVRTQARLGAIEGYNRDDCVSALRLRDWLETLRTELETKTGEALPRPAPKQGEPAENLAAYLQRVRAVTARLTADLPEEESGWTREQQAQSLLARLLEWHRREDKSAWWEYFRLLKLSDDELQQDKNALGGLVYIGEVDKVKRSIIHRYSFPLQEHSVERANDLRDPKTEKSAGSFYAMDNRNRTIDLKRGVGSQVPHPTALIPCDVVDTKVQRESLLRLGEWVAEHGVDAPGPYRAGRDLLLRRAPRFQSGSLQEVMGEERDPVEAAKRVTLTLEDSVLPIQGPPGSGKTYTASLVILDLVTSGKRVGITAASHKVINQLIGKVCEAASEAGLQLQAIQRADDKDDVCVHPFVTQAKSNDKACAALAERLAQVAGGTAWLWAREEMGDSVDYLFVDEAGQMSLANVLSISQAARNLELIGDPQQLDQPQRGVHPPGADVSALAHLLNGKATIPKDRGLFLDHTWRLHPDICRFTSELFYEGRLRSRDENSNQRINTKGALDGSGLRFCPVEHEGNQSESPEEAARVAELFDELLADGATWTNVKGEKRPVGVADILVVAPYNAQVSVLLSRLPEGAQVGTVDKFQGQQAPVVIYSMATSRWEDAPRGMEFLYSLNRLNVATSRARCVVVLVASPKLFEVECKTPRQMELANAFCRYLELATVI